MATTSGTLERKERDALLSLRRQRAERLPTPPERRAIRAAAGVAVEELADALGVSAAAIYSWETGTRCPGRKTRDRYREALTILLKEGVE